MFVVLSLTSGSYEFVEEDGEVGSS